jgi:hypothetical protein
MTRRNADVHLPGCTVPQFRRLQCEYFEYRQTKRSELLSFWTLSIVQYSKKIKEHNVSETGSVSVLRSGGGTPSQLGLLETANLNHWTTKNKSKSRCCSIRFYGNRKLRKDNDKFHVY